MKIRVNTVSMQNPSYPKPTSQRQTGPKDIELSDVGSIDIGEEATVVITLKAGSRVIADLNGMTSIPLVS
jgi:hypothetical protein